MKRVLIVSPRFPPRNAPDHHRVRTSLPYYAKFGWEPTVLCVTPETGDGVMDAALGESVAGVDALRVDAWPEEVCRRFGFGHLDYRCLLPLRRAGSAALRSRRFDVVFFSTTVFLSFLLGPGWKRRFGARIVYDMQDPWYTDENLYDAKTVPGSLWKYRLSRAIAAPAEAHAMRAADHILAVSPAYPVQLASRYPWLAPHDFTVCPFGGAQQDYDYVHEKSIVSPIAPVARARNWVYAGRIGPDMHGVLGAFFGAIAAMRKRRDTAVEGLRLLFVGTNYSSAERTYEVVAPIAARYGMGDMVTEHPARIPYFETLALYEASDGVLLFGADTPGYTASKLFNCILSRRPVLAMAHAESFVAGAAAGVPNVFLASFAADPAEASFARAIEQRVGEMASAHYDADAIAPAIARWSAEALTRVQCEVFDRVSMQ